MERINRQIFYSQFRSWFKRLRGRGLNEQEIAGVNFLLARVEQDSEWWRNERLAPKLLAYFLATVAHESGFTFQPIREGKASPTRNAHLWALQSRYWPSHEYASNDAYGRGYVQITWRENYEQADRKLNLGGSLAANPNRALEPEIAYLIASRGMREGWFTKGRHKLAMYVNESLTDYRHARQIINGMDRAADIATYAASFELMLRAATSSGEVAEARELEVAPLAPNVPVTFTPDEGDQESVVTPSDDGPRGGDAESPQNAQEASGLPVPAPPAPVQPKGTPPDQVVTIDATAPAKSRTNKSIVATLSAALAAIGIPYETIGAKARELFASGNPTGALIVLGVVAAVVVIYWKYQERQTRLDGQDREHAFQLNLAKMKIAADPDQYTVELRPNVTPARPSPAEARQGQD